MLVVLGGLPATGKSTVARMVADRLDAHWLRIDEIEQELRAALGLGEDVGEAGYAAAYRIAETNLALGRTVIADCVNPLAVTRAAWRAVAARASSLILEVDLACSDAAEPPTRRKPQQRRGRPGAAELAHRADTRIRAMDGAASGDQHRTNGAGGSRHRHRRRSASHGTAIPRVTKCRRARAVAAWPRQLNRSARESTLSIETRSASRR